MDQMQSSDFESPIGKLRAAQFYNLYEDNLQDLARRHVNIRMKIFIRAISICFALASVLFGIFSAFLFSAIFLNLEIPSV